MTYYTAYYYNTKELFSLRIVAKTYKRGEAFYKAQEAANKNNVTVKVLAERSKPYGLERYYMEFDPKRK